LPNAFAAYQKIGFKGIEDEKVKNGIIFIPLKLIIDNNNSCQLLNSADPKDPLLRFKPCRH